MDVAVIGAGRVGTALGVLLALAGHRIVAAAGRSATPGRVAEHLPGVPVTDPLTAASRATLSLLAVPDDAIEPVCRALAPGLAPGTWVAHVSGATGLDALVAAVEVGARRLAVHPLQSVPTVADGLARIPGSAMAVTAEDEEGVELGTRLARDVGCRPFRLADEHRALYHAAAVFASNHLVVTSAAAERLLRAAGIDDPLAAMLPLQRGTLDNVARLGPVAALTGPALRGDAGTIARNLAALTAEAPDEVPVYVAMARRALDLAVDAGRLDRDARAAVEDVLRRWR